MFRAIEKSRVSEDAVQQIVDLIRAGEFSPGDRLPSERQLAAQLQVSRTVARNALRRFPSLIRVAWAAAFPGQRRWIALAAPLVPLGAFAYALGAAIGRVRGH